MEIAYRWPVSWHMLRKAMMMNDDNDDFSRLWTLLLKADCLDIILGGGGSGGKTALFASISMCRPKT